MTFTEDDDSEKTKSSSFISKLDIDKIFNCASQVSSYSNYFLIYLIFILFFLKIKSIKQIIELPSKIEDLLSKSQYTSEYKNLLMNREQIPPELTIFLLRQQLL